MPRRTPASLAFNTFFPSLARETPVPLPLPASLPPTVFRFFRIVPIALAAVLALSPVPASAAKRSAKPAAPKTPPSPKPAPKPVPTPAPAPAAPRTPAPPPTPTQWKITEYRGLAYIDIQDVARFFDFGTVKPSEGGLLLIKDKVRDDGSRAYVELRCSSGSKLVSLNRLKFYLSYPVVRLQGERMMMSAFDLIHVLDPILRPDQSREPTKLKVIVLDPARGGTDPGLTSKFGTEKDITLDIARRLRPKLEKMGFTVFLTREEDSAVDVPDRVVMANAQHDEAIFLSIHVGFGAAGEKGVEMFTLSPCGTPSTTGDEGRPADQKFYPGNINDRESMALATALQGTLVKTLDASDLGIRRARFDELKGIAMPAVVCRVGRIGHAEEGKKLATPAYREKVADSMVTGIMRYADVMANGFVPKDRELKITHIDVFPDKVRSANGELVRVRATITKTNPDIVIDPKKVVLQMYFLDMVNNEEIDLSTCDTPAAEWISVLPNWRDARHEIVEFTYSQPAFDDAMRRSLGHRTYYGYVLRLAYNDRLMDEYSDPGNLRRGLGNFTAVQPRNR